MSSRHDHPDDMRRDPGIDERLAEDILRGRVDAVPGDHQPLAEMVSALRASTATSPPEPSAALQQVFAEGVRPEDAHDAVPTPAAVPATARGGRLRGALPRVAGLGLAVKLALAGAAAAAVAGGAGAAGVLPGQDGPPSLLPWQIEERELPEESESEGAEFGGEVADEAVTDTGVDGPDVAERAPEPRGDEHGDPLRSGRIDDAVPGADAADDHRDEHGEPGAETRDERGDVAEPDSRADDGREAERPPRSGDDEPSGAPTPGDTDASGGDERAPGTLEGSSTGHVDREDAGTTQDAATNDDDGTRHEAAEHAGTDGQAADDADAGTDDGVQRP